MAKAKVSVEVVEPDQVEELQIEPTEKKVIDLNKITVPSEDGDKIEYRFEERNKANFLNISQIKINAANTNINAVMFRLALGSASGLTAFIVKRLRNKEGFKDITKDEVLDLVFTTLPQLARAGISYTKGTGLEKIARGAELATRYMTLRPAIRTIVDNIKKGKANNTKVDYLGDLNLWLDLIPFVSNAVVIPYISNPTVIRKVVNTVKVVFGGKIESTINNIPVLKNLGISFSSESIFDGVNTGIEGITEYATKKGLVDEEEQKSKLTEKSLDVVNNVLVNKRYTKDTKNLLGINNVRNSSF